MRNITNFILTLLVLVSAPSCTKAQNMKRTLTDFEKHVIIDKGTEAPFTGEYTNFKGAGTYTCKQCGAPLYRSTDKFDSSCGWPSFDDQIEGTVVQIPDVDGRRTEIVCANCGGHLGHVFTGERFTQKDTRHCVNSISLVFIPDESNKTKNNSETAIFAGGCFWGVEHLMQNTKGVISTEVGYIGGTTENPTYEEVCSHKTGHAEAVRIIFDPTVVSYETLAKLFFEIHDPTQLDGQGPDLGDQYRSEIFYTTPEQKEIAEKLIGILKSKGYAIVTDVTSATKFYSGEDYHQHYYDRKGTQPYCHAYKKRF